MSYITLRPMQKGRHYADDILKYISFNDEFRISIKTSPIFVPVQWPNWHYAAKKALWFL